MLWIRTCQKCQFALFHGYFPLQFRDQCRRRGPLHQRLLIRDVGSQTSVKPDFGLLDTLIPGLQCSLDDKQFIVKRLKIKIRIGHLSYQRYLQRTLGFDTCEILGQFLPACPPEMTPQIYFPRKSAKNAGYRIIFSAMSRVVRIFVLSVNSRGNRRPELRALDLVAVFHLPEPFGSDKHVPVVFQSILYKLMQCRVRINLPPFHIRPGEGVRIFRRHECFRQIQLRRSAMFRRRA